MTQKNYSASYGTLQSAVANNGTLVVPYPSGTTQATFLTGAYAGQFVLITNKNNVYKESDSKLSVSYGASNITVTNLSGVSWNVGDTVDYGAGAVSPNYNFSGVTTPNPATLATGAGTAIAASGGVITIPDVGSSFSQSGLNNALATLAAQVNALQTALKQAGILI